MADFDVQGARQAGYSDADILKHLTDSRKFDVEGARKAGYSSADIITHLSSTPPPAATASPRTWLDSASDFAKGLWGNLSETGQGMINTVAHPFQTVKGIGTAQDAVRLKAEDAFKRGDYASGVRHVLSYAVPVVGPSIDASGDKAQAGHVAEALGEATSTGLQLAAPGVLGRAAPALGAAADAVSSATGKVVDIATHPAAREAIGVVSPRLKHALDVAARVKRAADAFKAEPGDVAPAATPKPAAAPPTAEPVPAPPAQPPTPPMPRDARRATAAPPETGIPEAQQRTQIARDQISQDLAGADYKDLSTADRGAVDKLVEQGYQGNEGAPPVNLRPPVRPQAANGGRPLSLQERAAQVKQERAAAVARNKAKLTPAAPAPAVEPPPAPVAAAPAPEAPAVQDLKKVGDMGSAISGGMYDMLWEKAKAGQVTEAGKPSALLQAAKLVRDRGGMQSAEDMRALAQDYGSIPRDANFQQSMRALVEQHSPAPVAEVPPTVEAKPPAGGAQPTPETAPPIDPADLRTAQKIGAARTAKAQRFAQALHDSGVTAEEASQIEPGALSNSQIQQGMTPRWGNIAESLGEKSPSELSVPQIMGELKKLEAAKAAEVTPVTPQPAPATRNTAPGGGMGAMKNYWGTPETPPVLTSPAVESRVATDVPTRAENQVAAIPQSGGSGNSSRYGEAVAVRVPGENRAYQARYALRELSEVKPSHNPVTLQSNPEYAYSNDRNYADPRNSERIIKQTAEFDPNYLVSDSPDATNGAPIIDRNGNVLGGNSRTMTLSRVYQGRTGGAAYRDLLSKKAAQFGLDPAHVAEMKHPVLVRELSHEISGEAAQPIITDLNKTGTASLTGAERAIADSNKLSASTMEQMAGMIENQGPDGTLAKALEGRGGAFIADQLVKDGVITTQEKPGLFDSAGNITPAAKDRISKLMLGRVFRDSAQFEGTPPAIRNKLERIMAPLSRVAGKEEWNLAPDVREAVDMLERARAAGSKNLDDLVAQQGLFGGGEEFSPRAVALAKALQSKGPLELAKDFARYANDSKGPTMFGEVSPGDAFAELTGTEATPPTAAKPPDGGAQGKPNALKSAAVKNALKVAERKAKLLGK